ncbi:MAG: nuclease, partial [Bacteroidota bacterium]
MARVSKSSVHAVLDRVADHIREAAGDDGITSRRDIRTKLTGLTGNERVLTDLFYRFMDHRDAKKGARITESDIVDTLAYAKEKLVDQYDLNRNGLSRAEIEKMSNTGKLAVALARSLKRQSQSEERTEADLLQEIEALVPGVQFDDMGSEASIEISAYYKAGSLETLTKESFSQLLGLDNSLPTEDLARFIPADADDFYERFVDINRYFNKEEEAESLINLM